MSFGLRPQKFIRKLWLAVSLWSAGMSPAFAQTAPERSSLEVLMPAFAALIGGLLSGIFGPIIKDLFIARLNERRSNIREKHQIEQSYFAPLSASSERIIWRMSEILLDRRSQFLMLRTLPTDYNKYKRTSTLYRIAALLGWMRAVSLELSALPQGGFGKKSKVATALASVQSALADGHGVVVRRLESFCAACAINLSSIPPNEIKSLAADFEVALYSLAGVDLRHDHMHIFSAPILKQEFICRGLIHFLSNNKLCDSYEKVMAGREIADLTRYLGYKESLIYREWQDAIGDAMILKDENSMARRYRIVGFEEFERILLSKEFNWIDPLSEFVEDVSFEASDPTDERPRHLVDFSKGVAAVLIAISDSSHGALVNDEALARAKKIIELKNLE